MWILRTPDHFEPKPLTIRILPGAAKTIGRSSIADFNVDVPMLSRVHCRLVASASKLEVEDLDSTNGTFVNETRIKRQVLQQGDQLRVGRLILVVERMSD